MLDVVELLNELYEWHLRIVDVCWCSFSYSQRLTRHVGNDWNGHIDTVIVVVIIIYHHQQRQYLADMWMFIPHLRTSSFLSPPAPGVKRARPARWMIEARVDRGHSALSRQARHHQAGLAKDAEQPKKQKARRGWKWLARMKDWKIELM